VIRPSPSRTVAAAVVGLAVAVTVTGLAAGDRAAGSPALRSAVVPVTDSVLVCPAVPAASSTTSSVVSASSPGTSGTIRISALAALDGATLARLAPGASVVRYSPPKGAKTLPVVVHATGERARALTANVVTGVSAGITRALSTVPCTEPAGDTWLMGGSGAGGRRDVVFLTNADQAPAVVDLSVFGPAGVLQPSSAQGVTVGPRAQLALALDALAPGVGSAAVLVHVRSGRVASALQDTAAVGSVPAGVDWVPPSTPPSTHQVVAGIPGESTARHLLLLLVPGQQDATVRVRFATPNGTLSPGTVNALDVTAGRVTAINLDKAGVSPPWSLLVDANQPVLAGVQTVEGGPGKLADFSWAGSAPALVGPSVVVPWVARGALVSTTAQLTATGPDDVVVQVTSMRADGTAGPPQQVTVPAGRQLQVALGVPGQVGTGWALVQAPPGAHLVVSWYTRLSAPRGPMIAGGPLVQTPLTVTQPPAVADPAVGYPGH
jgi:hypothetical protein